MRVSYSPDFIDSVSTWPLEVPLDSHTERYQYVPMRKLPKFALAPAFTPDGDVHADVVLSNGKLLRAAEVDGLEIYRLEQARQLFGSTLQRRLNESAAGEADLFADLARHTAPDPIVIYVPARAQPAPLSLSLLQHGLGWACQRVVLIVGQAAQLELTIEQNTDCASTLLLEAWVESGGRLSIQQRDWAKQAWSFSALRAVQAQNSTLHWTAVTDGGDTVRWDGHVQLRGEAAEAKLSGLWCLEDAQQAHAHIVIEHQAPHCVSDQLYKGVGSNNSNASFEGHIVVAKLAQKTQAYQLNQNLLLDRSARAQSKPSLKVYADDVKASHGSTTGRVDEEALFYLASRGVCPELAKQLLVQAFAHELLHTLPEAWHPSLVSSSHER